MPSDLNKLLTFAPNFAKVLLFSLRSWYILFIPFLPHPVFLVNGRIVNWTETSAHPLTHALVVRIPLQGITKHIEIDTWGEVSCTKKTTVLVDHDENKVFLVNMLNFGNVDKVLCIDISLMWGKYHLSSGH